MDRYQKMKKLSSNHRLNKVLAKCDASSTTEFSQIKSATTGWAGRLGDAKRALSRKAKEISSASSSSSTPCLFFAAPPPPKRSPSTTLTLRSKSMTTELEELGECQNTIRKFATSLPLVLSCFYFPAVITCHISWLFEKSLLLVCSCPLPCSADAIFVLPSFCSEEKRRWVWVKTRHLSNHVVIWLKPKSKALEKSVFVVFNF